MPRIFRFKPISFIIELSYKVSSSFYIYHYHTNTYGYVTATSIMKTEFIKETNGYKPYITVSNFFEGQSHKKQLCEGLLFYDEQIDEDGRRFCYYGLQTSHGLEIPDCSLINRHFGTNYISCKVHREVWNVSAPYPMGIKSPDLEVPDMLEIRASESANISIHLKKELEWLSGCFPKVLQNK